MRTDIRTVHSGVVDFDAIILTGGTGQRLGGVDKAALRVDGTSLLERTLDAVSAAQGVVLVGGRQAGDADERITVVREQPAGGGPAAAIGAGVNALDGSSSVVVVVACDMPGIALAIPVLLHALASTPEADGVLARDGHQIQYLVGAHRSAAMRAAVQSHDTLHGSSVRALMDALALHVVDVPTGSTADIDTWEDAATAGASLDSTGDA